MPRKCCQTALIALVAAGVWVTCCDIGFAVFRGHRRYPTGNSPIYPQAISPHGGFSSSNGYYSGRSRIADAPPPVSKPGATKTAPAK